MATYRLLHVTKDGSDTDGLAEYTNSDTVLLPLHSSDPAGSAEGEMIYNSTANTIKIFDGSSWISLADTDTTLTLVDDDTFGTAAANTVPSSESTKAYVDTQISGHDGQHSDITLNTFAAPTGAVDINDQELSKAVIKDYTEKDVALSSASGVVAVDLANGNTGSLTLTENVTDIDFTNVPTDGTSTFTLKITQDASTARTVAINAVTVNGGGNVTALTAGGDGFTMTATLSAIDIVTFIFFDAGTPFLNALQEFS